MKIQRYLLSILALTLACFVGIAIRPAFPGGAKAASADPITVLCTCTLGTNIAPLYLVIRDETTGQVWAYPHYPTASSSGSIEPGANPILLGTLVPGKPIK